MQCACVKLIRMREVSLVAFSARQVRSRTTAIAVTKVTAHEGTDDISATSPTPQEPFSEETIRAIADCVVKQLRSSTQDGDTSRAVEPVPSATVSQGTSGGELSVALMLLIGDILRAEQPTGQKILSALRGETAVRKGCL